LIRLLIVEDSSVVREFLIHILSSDPEIQVIGTANDGEEALEAVERSRPDIITMDIHMPKINGMEATRRIMETHPTPIIIVSGSLSTNEVSTAFRALEAGALAVVQKPAGLGHPDHDETAASLVRTVKLLSEVKVVRRWARSPRTANMATVSPPAEVQLLQTPKVINIITMGASTGGPPALQTILSGLPVNFPVPVLIVQHMAAGFIHGFVEWLSQTSRLPVHVATHGEPILSSHVYVAPDGFQMKVGLGERIWLTRDDPENGLRPSVSYLFRSVANLYGPNAIGVLLTGMGKDGAAELKLLKEKGAVTIAQDKESSVVHGMPGEAINLGAATYVLSPDRIAVTLTSLVNGSLKATGSRKLSYT
jgi:two-component system chemotaxis response regulator CheB